MTILMRSSVSLRRKVFSTWLRSQPAMLKCPRGAGSKNARVVNANPNLLCCRLLQRRKRTPVQALLARHVKWIAAKQNLNQDPCRASGAARRQKLHGLQCYLDQSMQVLLNEFLCLWFEPQPLGKYFATPQISRRVTAFPWSILLLSRLCCQMLPLLWW